MGTIPMLMEQARTEFLNWQKHKHSSFKAQSLFYVPPVLTYKNSTLHPQRVYPYVPHGSHIKQRLFVQTALTGWAL
jgi:hypothetical protein